MMRLRAARPGDIAALERLIEASVHELLPAFYTREQRVAAIGPVFGVDAALIDDGTYFVVEHSGEIAGCGGWSRRHAVFGGDRARAGADAFIDPATDPARIRAFFVHPRWARRGVAALLLRACEEAIRAAGFRDVTMVATLAGELFYAKYGYVVDERYDVPLAAAPPLAVVRMSKRL